MAKRKTVVVHRRFEDRHIGTTQCQLAKLICLVLRNSGRCNIPFHKGIIHSDEWFGSTVGTPGYSTQEETACPGLLLHRNFPHCKANNS